MNTINTMKDRRLTTQPVVLRRKLVLVGDVQCGKTAMLRVLTRDPYPQTYVPTVFENYTASLELEEQRVELSLWDTSGSPYYNNVRPLCYSDSDAVLLCFDVSLAAAADSSLKKWKAEIMDFCPSTRILLIGCKTDLRSDSCALAPPPHCRRPPVSHDQGVSLAKQIGAQAYLECSAFASEKSVRAAFRQAAAACVHAPAAAAAAAAPAVGLSKRLLRLSSCTMLASSAFRTKDPAKSCAVM